MAITYKYVTTAGAGGHTGADEANAWTLAEAIAAPATAAAGNTDVMVKYDSGHAASNKTLTGVGSIANNYHLRYRGYYTSFSTVTGIGDMDPGQPYYGSAYDALLNALGLTMTNTNAKWVNIDCAGAAAALIFNATHNMEFHGMRFYNSTANQDIIQGNTNNSNGVIFKHCKFEPVGTGQAIDSSAGTGGLFGSLYVDDCFATSADNSGSSHLFYVAGNNSRIFRNCITYYSNAANTATAIYYRNGSAGGGLIENCLMIGGLKCAGFRTETGQFVFRNNTCYGYKGTGSAGMLTQDAAVIAQCYNNIFMPAAISDCGVTIAASYGSISYLNYNNAVSIATKGALTIPYYTTLPATIGAIEETGPNNLAVDPQFDANPLLTGDFNPHNWQMMEGGKPDCAGNPTHIGWRNKPSVYDIIYGELV